MRVGIISDIHGNLVGLNAVLRSLEHESLDSVVCLGDVAATGPKPHEVLARLKDEKYLCVMGNTDDWLLKPEFTPGSNQVLRLIEEVDFWCSEQLTESDKEFVRSFKSTVRITFGDKITLLACHGSPRSYHEWISSSASEEELAQILEGTKATIVAMGHTHRQMLRKYRDMILVNPGSVGTPYERDRLSGKVQISPWAEYAIISEEKNNLEVSFRRVPVDSNQSRRDILDSTMPYNDEILEMWKKHIETLLVENKLS